MTTTTTNDSIDLTTIIPTLAKYSWNHNAGIINPYTPLTISYSFLTAKPAYDLTAFGSAVLFKHEINQSFSTLSSPQIEVVEASVKAWAAVANITFNKLTGSDIGQIAIVNTELKSALGDTVTPSSNVNDINVFGDIFLDSSSTLNTQLKAGEVGYLTILHELGHALGLDHPAQDNPPNPNDNPPFLPTSVSNTRYSVMVNYHNASLIDGKPFLVPKLWLGNAYPQALLEIFTTSTQ